MHREHADGRVPSLRNAECGMHNVRGTRGRQSAVPTSCYLLLITCYLLLVTYYLSLVPCFSLALALLRPDSSTARTTEKTLAELPVRDGSTPYRA